MARLVHGWWRIDEEWPHLRVVLIVAAVVFVFSALLVLAFFFGADMKNCKRSHSETTTTYMSVGNIMTPITSTHQVCDEWYPEAQEGK
jgi:hypothetical protein